jgi:hypothetical protein
MLSQARWKPPFSAKARINSSGFVVQVMLEDHSNAVFSVVFSPDSSKLVSASAERTLRVCTVAVLDPVAAIDQNRDFDFRTPKPNPDNRRS